MWLFLLLMLFKTHAQDGGPLSSTIPPQFHSNRSTNQRGMVVCSGGGDMFLETIAMIEQTRYRMKSTLPIVVAHCKELNADALSILAMIPDVSAMNLCNDKSFPAEAMQRIKGFFCKPAALIMSPFKDTILVDSDVIWFKQPELLFDAREYRDTGTLFFRDRWTQTKNQLTLSAGQHTGKVAMRMVNQLHSDYKDNHVLGANKRRLDENVPGTTHFNASGHRQLLVPLRNLGHTAVTNLQRQQITRPKPRPVVVNMTQQNLLRDRLVDPLELSRIPPAPMSGMSSNFQAPRRTQKPPGRTTKSSSSSGKGIGIGGGGGQKQNKDKTTGKFTAEGLAKHNAFWRHLATGVGFTPDHWQDSSVLLLDSTRHPRTLLLLRRMVRDFSLGYGDKEMYWLAATAVEEPFAFEPFIAGSLGDCGAIVHFDPLAAPFVQQDKNTKVLPFYVNAEYLIDLKKIQKEGDFLGIIGSDLTQATLMNEVTTPLYKLQPWSKMPHGFYPCGACQSRCVPSDDGSVHIQEVNHMHILLPCLSFLSF